MVESRFFSEDFNVALQLLQKPVLGGVNGGTIIHGSESGFVVNEWTLGEPLFKFNV